MKKRTYHLVFAILSGLCLTCILVMQALKMGETYLWIGGITTAKLMFLVSSILSWLVCGWLVMIIWGRVRSKARRCWAYVELALLMLPVLCVQWIAWRVNYSDDCLVFTSTEGDHTVVVQEETGILSHGHTVFELTSEITMRKVGTFSSDLHHPEEVEVQWSEDVVDISVRGCGCRCTLLQD